MPEQQPSPNEKAASAARDAGYSVADMVYEKQLAYGDAASMQRGLWCVLLKQYEQGDGTYRVPQSLFDHVPRLTRVFDRIARLVSNPGADRAGEDPWRDLTGDAMVGMVMPRTPAPSGSNDEARPRKAECGEPYPGSVTVIGPWTGHIACQLEPAHMGPHAYEHGAGVLRWEALATGTLHVELARNG